MSQLSFPVHPILIVDDEDSLLLSIDTSLQMAGFNNTITCNDSRKVLDIFADNTIGTLLLDLNMPDISGHEILELVTADYPEVPVVIITGDVDVDSAVQCMKAGAFDYVVKPLDQEKLISSLNRALAVSDLKRENIALKQQILSPSLENPDHFAEIITGNKGMLSIFQYIESIAKSSQAVLVWGETGVGKELIAKAIHNSSGLPGEFVAVNVAGLDDNVFSDTLFGHVKGAFTGAERERPGLIEQAAGGTLFLDEIGDLAAASQVKLLRLLQEGEYLPLGADKHKRTNVRIIAATNRDVWALQKAGSFRKDLIYRLCTHHIHVPALCDRQDDIPLLLKTFLRRAAKSLGKKQPSVPRELYTLLRTYSFAGNIRELQAMVFDAVSTHKSGVLSMDVFKSHIDSHRARQATPASGGKTDVKDEEIVFPADLPTIKQATHLLIAEALQRSDGNQSIAARMLGISQQALSKRLKSM